MRDLNASCGTCHCQRRWHFKTYGGTVGCTRLVGLSNAIPCACSGFTMTESQTLKDAHEAEMWQRIFRRCVARQYDEMVADNARLTADLAAAEARGAALRETLALIAGAFTSGIYCANCGDGIETCRCILDLARTALLAPGAAHEGAEPGRSLPVDASAPRSGHEDT